MKFHEEATAEKKGKALILRTMLALGLLTESLKVNLAEMLRREALAQISSVLLRHLKSATIEWHSVEGHWQGKGAGQPLVLPMTCVISMNVEHGATIWVVAPDLTPI